MTDEELRELEHQYDSGRWAVGGGGWGRSPGGGGSLSHHRMAPPHHASSRAAEAEDIVGRGVGTRGRSGLYYSPPGTSYTIVERPTMTQPRGTYLGASSSAIANAAGKKRPISPEQVLKFLGQKVPSEPPTQPRRPVPPPPTMEQLTVRTVNMSRGPSEGSQGHGFGICVKGGANDSGKFQDNTYSKINFANIICVCMYLTMSGLTRPKLNGCLAGSRNPR